MMRRPILRARLSASPMMLWSVGLFLLLLLPQGVNHGSV